MRKNALLTFGASILLIMSSCQKEHSAPMNPEKIKPETEKIDQKEPSKEPNKEVDDHKKDDPVPPVEKDDQEPDTTTPQVENNPQNEENDKEPRRPSDRDIANRLSVKWKTARDIEEKITLDVDALFDQSRDVNFTTEQLSKFVIFQATAVGSSKVYILTENDLKNLTLSNFRYEGNGLIKFEAQYRDQKKVQLSLSFSRDKYYTNKIRPKNVSQLFMHGIHHNPDLFTSDLFEYDDKKYEVHIKNSVSSRNSLSLVLSVDRKTKDGHLATLNYTIEGFKPLSQLKLTLSPQSELSGKIARYYRQEHSVDWLNKTIMQWIKQIDFVLTRDNEKIQLGWDKDEKNKQDVLTPVLNAKKYADIYFISPRFTVTEIQKLQNEKLKVKIKLNFVDETEVEDTNLDLIVTIPSK